MKNVLLIGDSIRKGYCESVKESLAGIANVYFPEENCRFAAFLLRNIHVYKGLVRDGDEVDVVHWNAGLWDCLRMFGEDPLVPLDFYAYYIERLCVRIKKLFPTAKVIFATSTRVQSEKMSDEFKRYNEDIEAYNKVAVEIVKKHGFAVNDLYALSATLPEEAHSDAVHYYTPLGTRAFTNQVLDFVCDALDTPTVSYKEMVYTDEPFGI